MNINQEFFSTAYRTCPCKGLKQNGRNLNKGITSIFDSTQPDTHLQHVLIDTNRAKVQTLSIAKFHFSLICCQKYSEHFHKFDKAEHLVIST